MVLWNVVFSLDCYYVGYGGGGGVWCWWLVRWVLDMLICWLWWYIFRVLVLDYRFLCCVLWLLVGVVCWVRLVRIGWYGLWLLLVWWVVWGWWLWMVLLYDRCGVILCWVLMLLVWWLGVWMLWDVWVGCLSVLWINMCWFVWCRRWWYGLWCVGLSVRRFYWKWVLCGLGDYV